MIQRLESKGMLVRRKAVIQSIYVILASLYRVKQQTVTILKTRNHETDLSKMTPLIHCFHFHRRYCRKGTIFASNTSDSSLRGTETENLALEHEKLAPFCMKLFLL